MFSIFLFANVGLIVPFFVRPVYALSPRLLFFLPKRYLVWKSPHVLPVMAFVFIIIMILPVALDGFRQMLTDYESVNILRFLTGIPTGFVGGLLIGSMLNGTYFMGKDLDVG